MWGSNIHLLWWFIVIFYTTFVILKTILQFWKKKKIKDATSNDIDLNRPKQTINDQITSRVGNKIRKILFSYLEENLKRIKSCLCIKHWLDYTYKFCLILYSWTLKLLVILYEKMIDVISSNLYFFIFALIFENF